MRTFVHITIAAAICGCSDSKVSSRGSSVSQKTADGGVEVSSTNENGDADAMIFVPDGVDSNNLDIQPGASVANQTTASYLTYSGEIERTGDSFNVTLKDSPFIIPPGQLVLQLPNPNAEGAALRLRSSDVAVFYHVRSFATGKYEYGLIPYTKFKGMTPDKITIALIGFGNYQAAVVSDAGTNLLSAPTADVPQPASAGTASTTTTSTTLPSSGSSNGTGLGTGGVTTVVSIPEAKPMPIVTYHDHSCALKANELYCWGRAISAEINSPSLFLPQKIVLGTTKWKQVAIGAEHACAISTDGSLWCWGKNQYGQLGMIDGGNQAVVARTVPAPVGIDTDWTWIAASANHSCGIRGGNVYCWGENDAGIAGSGTAPFATPNEVLKGDYVQVETSGGAACARAADGNVRC